MLVRCIKRCMALGGGEIIELGTTLETDTIPGWDRKKGHIRDHFVSIDQLAQEAQAREKEAAADDVRTAEAQLAAAQETVAGIQPATPTPPGGDLED